MGRWISGNRGSKSIQRKESFIHKMFAKTFYSIISDATGIDMSRASDFKLMDRQAAEEFLKNFQNEMYFFRALSSWVGFKTTYVEFDVQEREAGESKWSFKSLVRYAVNNITSFSAAPMQIVTFLWRCILRICSTTWNTVTLYVFFWTCSCRIHNSDLVVTVGWKHFDVQLRCDRILYCEDL